MRTPESQEIQDMHRVETRGTVALFALFLSVSAAWAVFVTVPYNEHLNAVQDCAASTDFENTDPEVAWRICVDQLRNQE